MRSVFDLSRQQPLDPVCQVLQCWHKALIADTMLQILPASALVDPDCCVVLCGIRVSMVVGIELYPCVIVVRVRGSKPVCTVSVSGGWSEWDESLQYVPTMSSVSFLSSVGSLR